MNPSNKFLHSEIQSKPATWVVEAARRPLAFAQVREDALLDQWVVRQLNGENEVLMVASGGCSACVLAAVPNVSRLHVIDPNPAQIPLCRFKLRLLPTTEQPERLSLLGHA